MACTCSIINIQNMLTCESLAGSVTENIRIISTQVHALLRDQVSESGAI